MFDIRNSLSEKPRKPLSQEAFAELLTKQAQAMGIDARYLTSTVSDLENGKRRLSLEDVSVIAAVDPQQRGKLWLAFGEEDPPKSRSVIPLEPPQEPYTGKDTNVKRRRRRAR